MILSLSRYTQSVVHVLYSTAPHRGLRPARPDGSIIASDQKLHKQCRMQLVSVEERVLRQAWLVGMSALLDSYATRCFLVSYAR
jgi:hypothetical protein